jgi:uncharacterized membrane protein YdjX (TVP38/TMEM64 family)
MKINLEKLKSWIELLVFIAVIVLITVYSSQFFANVENVRNLIGKAGILAPLAFMLIQFIQVVIAPISHYAIQIAGGAIFGVWLGGVLNYVGSVAGSIFVFFLSRKYGKLLVNKIVSKKIIDKYESVVQKMGPFSLFLIYFLPLFPDDEISYLAGLSRMKFKDYLIANLLGRTGGMFGMALIGATIAKPTKIGIIIIIFLILLAAALFFFRKRLERWFKKRSEKKIDID